MWQRFTDRAKRVVFWAEEEAIRLGDNLISTEHLLLALLRDENNLALAVLYRLGIARKRIRSGIEQYTGLKQSLPSLNLLYAPLGKRILELAYDEARLLENNYIGTEHLLLALIRETEGVAGRLLVAMGADLEKAREEVKKLQSQGVYQVVQEMYQADGDQRPNDAELRARLLEAINQLPEHVRKQVQGSLADKTPDAREPGRGLTSQEDADRNLEFDALFAKYEKKIFNIIYRFIGDYEEASDLTQETFISAHRHFDSFRGETKVFTWLYQIARSLTIQHIREREERRR